MTVSAAALILSASVRSLKIFLLGTDYSDRLFTTVFVNFVLALALALYLGQAQVASRRRCCVSRVGVAVVGRDKFRHLTITLKLFGDAHPES